MLMKHNNKIVVSASRRTDIPAFYMDWFMAGIRQGCFSVVNPFSQAVTRISVQPDDVHTIVFWSKNYSHFLKQGCGPILEEAGYHLFFHFTINSELQVLEPNVPPLVQRLEQLAQMAYKFGPLSITWRFDPICYFTVDGKVFNNLSDFKRIADAAAACGIKRCVTSFLDIYRKIEKRCRAMDSFSFFPPAPEKQAEILMRMKAVLSERGITLFTCCEKRTVPILPPEAGISGSACIDHGLLEQLHGPGLSGKKDRGQRISQGCGCMESRDIGSYRLHPCWHNCLFCYANPKA